MLLDHLLASLNQQYPSRHLQIRSLAAFYNDALPSPPNLVVHGTTATGKSAIIRSVLAASGLSHAVIDCRESITGRHLLERTIASVLDALDAYSATDFDVSHYARCENISALAVQLQRLLEGGGPRRKFVLVFDGIDKQREAPPTLLPALARFGDMIPSLSTIFVTTTARPPTYHHSSLPHLPFPPYSRHETLQILSLAPPLIFTRAISPSMHYSDADHREDSAWVWQRFCGVVWDSYGRAAARDLVSFRAVCERLWRPFVSSIEDMTFGTRDFARLVVAKRALFQGEEALGDAASGQAVVPVGGGGAAEAKKQRDKGIAHLPYYARFLLCAAYLASFNAARQDHVFFAKAHDKKRRKRAAGGAGAGKGRAAKHRRIPRHLLNPAPFTLDRLLAILHAILPDPLPRAADVLTLVATLASLRLLLKTGGVGDALEPGGKWRVSFGWEYAKSVGRSVGFEIEEWVAGDVA